MKLQIDDLSYQTYPDSSLFYILKGQFLVYDEMKFISLNKIFIFNY